MTVIQPIKESVGQFQMSDVESASRRSHSLIQVAQKHNQCMRCGCKRPADANNNRNNTLLSLLRTQPTNPKIVCIFSLQQPVNYLAGLGAKHASQFRDIYYLYTVAAAVVVVTVIKRALLKATFFSMELQIISNNKTAKFCRLWQTKA